MLGDIFGMMDKLNKAKEAIKETNEKLDQMRVECTSAGGFVKVVSTGNKEIRDIELSHGALALDKDQLQDYLVNTMNEALRLATEMKTSETKRATEGLIPNIPGFDLGALGL